MSAPQGIWPRLCGLLSLRTISGRLIIGLIVLIGLASAAVSVVTANSLSDSLMSSLNQQLQSATSRWMDCVQPRQDDEGDGSDTMTPPVDPEDTACAAEVRPGRRDVRGGADRAVGYKHILVGACPLSAADETTLA